MHEYDDGYDERETGEMEIIVPFARKPVAPATRMVLLWRKWRIILLLLLSSISIATTVIMCEVEWSKFYN